MQYVQEFTSGQMKNIAHVSCKPAVAAVKNLSLKAVYSRSLKSARMVSANLSDADLYSDDQASDTGKSLEHLLSRSDVHAVIIALPILSQHRYIRTALLAGKHVLSEKPIAENVAHASSLLEWYRSEIDPTGLIWGVAENYRFLSGFVEGAKLASKMGRLQGFRLKKHWNQDPRYLEKE